MVDICSGQARIHRELYCRVSVNKPEPTCGKSSSYSTTALEFEKEHQIAPVYESPRMSRRSLRLKNMGQLDSNSVVDNSYSQSSSSYSSSTRKDTRTPRSKKQQSASRSLSLSQAPTPRVALSFSAASTPDSSELHETNTSFDASLHSSVLDPSQVRQRNVSTIITTTSTAHEHRERGDHSTSVNGGCSANSSKSHTAVANGYLCEDCVHHSSQRTGVLTTQRTSSSSSSSSRAQEASTDVLSSSSSPFTSIYSRDRSRRNKTGVLRSISNTCMSCSRQTLASVVSLFTVFFNTVLWVGSQAKSLSGKGVFSSFSSSVGQALSSSVSRLQWLKQCTLHRVLRYNRKTVHEEQAHSSFCGSLNVKDLATEDASHLKFNGSLCDDCKGKQTLSDSHAVLHTHCSRRRRLAGALWSVLAFTGYCLLQPGYCVVNAAKALASGVGTATHKSASLFWLLLAAPVSAGKRLLWFLACGWYSLVSLMSLLNVFFLTSLPKLWKLLLLLLLLLPLLALWLWGPSAAVLLTYLPVVNITDWRAASPIALLSNQRSTQESVSVSAPAPAPEAPVEYTPATPVSQAPSAPPPVLLSGVDLSRLEHVEQQLALLWEQVKQGDAKLEQWHGDVLVLYGRLKEQLHTQTDRESLGLWVSSLMEQRLGVLQGELQKDGAQRAETAEQHKQQQEIQGARLAEVELRVKALAARTEEVQQKQQHVESEREESGKQAFVATPVSVGVQQDDHDALLADVKRLESELGRIRADLQGVIGCKGKCEQLDTLREDLSTQISSQISSQLSSQISSEVSAQISSEVSAQVRKELQALFYGSGNEGEVPESLLLWLSQHYTRTPDLRAALAQLELSILRNVSLQLELNKAQTMGEVQSHAQSIVQLVTGTVQHSASAEGLSEEHVKVIVQNALKLFSQDRTGLVDFALESGGGSILSTRCSETYETKTALMSLFGLPLWYFSQSPRAVIQPDVYPGNCWAFKGSQGYLVIRLSMRVLPTSFCVEHIPKALSPTGNITSAPRNFTVYGLDNEYQEEGKLLGNYIYQEDGDSLQSFPVMEPNDKAFQIIEVRVLSNWGHPEYTCLYRFRVHGEPQPL
ncbi:SUN domain-containing protein 1 isoform X2 [Eucyclogobius newberryi]|uniref:SUN domain-containing protein 1 isoform X2 n=1 Tax=Eucyclogobius newberryi TaxID=166745 RepID=UPI003B5B8DEE